MITGSITLLLHAIYKKCPITDYIRLHEKCNRLQPITITNYDYPMSVTHSLNDKRGNNFR
jgi:hypothetical protein